MKRIVCLLLMCIVLIGCSSNKVKHKIYDEDITFDADSLKDATTKFKSNLTNVSEFYSSFSELLAEAIDGVYLPWDDLPSTWDEAKKKVKSVTEETEEHIDKLIKEANAFVTEISRVDHLVANQMVARQEDILWLFYTIMILRFKKN